MNKQESKTKVRANSQKMPGHWTIEFTAGVHLGHSISLTRRSIMDVVVKMDNSV